MKECGVLFDLDGVLIDSESGYTELWRGIEKKYPTGIDNFAIRIKGTTLGEIMKFFPDKSIHEDIFSMLDEYQSNMSFKMFPEVQLFLETLKEHHIPAAIVTSSDERKMARLFDALPGFRNYFTAIIDASMVNRSKPDPQGYLLCAKALSRDIKDCIVFEDSLQGLAAGRAAGATVIALATTYPREMLKDKAATVIDGFENFTVEQMLDIRD
ncbi:MAG: HAD family phosphatase [Paramuribaculum sp.]|nr:HAD family phosphatase [Paramuribaculum sp.]